MEAQDEEGNAFFINGFLDWVEKTLTYGKKHAFKNTDSFNVADSAMVFSTSVTTTADDDYILQVQGDIQTVLDHASNKWYIFPSFAITTQTGASNYYDEISLVATPQFTLNNQWWSGNMELFDLQPNTNLTSTNYTNSFSVGFSAGVSFSALGPTVSVSVSATYTHSTQASTPPLSIKNTSSISGATPYLSFQWNQNPSYSSSINAAWYWTIPFDESLVGTGNINSELASISLNGDNGDYVGNSNIPLSHWTFKLPDMGTPNP